MWSTLFQKMDVGMSVRGNTAVSAAILTESVTSWRSGHEWLIGTLFHEPIYLYSSTVKSETTWLWPEELWIDATTTTTLTVTDETTIQNLHTVTKGKRHNAGCTCHTKTRECVIKKNTVMIDECFWINAPQWRAWQKRKKIKRMDKIEYIYTKTANANIPLSNFSGQCVFILVPFLTQDQEF